MNTSSSVERTTQSPFADYFKEVIYGGIDGIVTTFAVVAGFSGAALANETTTQLSFMVVLLFGLANLFADGVSMGLGNFLSVRSEQDLYRAARKEEARIVTASPEAELAYTQTLLESKGFTATDAATIARLYATNEPYWLDFMMSNGREMSDPRGENAALNGLATFGSFLVFGAIPLLPFIVAADAPAQTVFYYSIIGTVVALVCLGILKWRVVGEALSKSLTEVLLVGGTAAVIAYMVGMLFSL